jgi:hypothetical protein
MFVGLQINDVVPATPCPTKMSAYRLRLPSGEKIVVYTSTPSGVHVAYMDLEHARTFGEALVKIAADNLILTPDIMAPPQLPPNRGPKR